MIDRNLEWILEDVIRKNYREGLFTGELPGHWNEDDVVDYAMSKFHLKQSSMATGRMGLFKAEQESAPDWAKKLQKKIDILSDILPPYFAKMRKIAKVRRLMKGQDLRTKEEKELYKGPMEKVPAEESAMPFKPQTEHPFEGPKLQESSKDAEEEEEKEKLDPEEIKMLKLEVAKTLLSGLPEKERVKMLNELIEAWGLR